MGAHLDDAKVVLSAVLRQVVLTGLVAGLLDGVVALAVGLEFAGLVRIDAVLDQLLHPNPRPHAQ
jgi:hypothetical protein